MTFPTRQEIDALIALAEKATPGPWDWADGGSFGGFWLSHQGDPAEPTIAATMGPDIRTVGNEANQKFIAASRSAVPALAVALEEAMELLRGLRSALEDQVGAGHPVSPRVVYAASQARVLLAAFEPGDQSHE